MSKWDDDFDLDDFDAKPANKKSNKPKVKKQEDDFFDLEDQTTSKPNKLPVINNKASKQLTTNVPDKNPKKSKNIYDDYEEIYEEVQDVSSPKKNVSKKEVEESNYYEQLEEIEQSKPKNESSLPKVLPKASKSYDEEQYYEEIQQVKPPARQMKKIQPKSPKKSSVVDPSPPKEQNSYQQAFDEYGQDFQQPVHESPKKSNTHINLKSKDKNVKQNEPKAESKKYAINSNQVFTNKNRKDTRTQPSVPKPPQKQNKLQTRNASKKTIEKAPHVSQQPKQLQKSHSRKSLKSNDSRSHIGNSRVTKKYMTQFTTNKHMLLVQRTFPDDDNKLGSLSIDRLTRMNEHVRQMIRKFNDELNELINKNMILLKDKPLEKERKSDDKVRILNEQLKSGATALEVVQNQYQRLKGREGELKQEEYLLIMEKRIDEAKEQIKETAKQIHKYQVEVNSDGKKLSKQQVQKKLAQDLHQIKTMLIQTKKEQEKQESKLQKLNKMLEDLEGKNSDKQYQLSEQVDAAKQKGITINIKQALLKKYEEMKARVSITENHCKSLQGLHKNKSEMINHQNEQIKISIRNLESQIKNMYHTIEHSQDESIKVIKKSKENPKLNSHIGQSLDKILKYLEENQNNAYFDVRSQGNKSQASERPLKKSMYENMNKEKQSRNSASKNQQKPHKTQPQNDEINLMKPNFMKKKARQVSAHHDEEQETNKLYERVWSQEEQKRKKEEERKKAEQEQEKKKQEERKKLAEQDKKKPFNLKKNRLKNEDKSFEVSPQRDQEKCEPKIQIPEVKEQQKPTIGPKFTRFNRKERNQSKNDLSIDRPQQKIQPKKIAEQIPQQDPSKEEQAIFKPKRFNLRNRLEKKDDSYVPTVETKKQQAKEQEPYVPKASYKEEYVPKASFKQEQPIKIPSIPVEKPEIKTQEPEEKPIVPIRLRNRQRLNNNNEDTSYLPTRMTEPESTINQKNIDSGYNPTKREPIKEKAQDSYIPSYKKSDKQEPINNPYAPKPAAKQNIPSVRQSKPIEEVSNPYAPKPPANNPYAPPVEEKPIVNPYAPKEDAPKREKEGPVKKIKIQNKAPKEKFNIYEQAQDLTEPAIQPINSPPKESVAQKPVYNINLGNTADLNLDAMLGKQKKKPVNDYGDLLGDVKIDKKKEKKKNANDFFNDLLLD